MWKQTPLKNAIKPAQFNAVCYIILLYKTISIKLNAFLMKGRRTLLIWQASNFVNLLWLLKGDHIVCVIMCIRVLICQHTFNTWILIQEKLCCWAQKRSFQLVLVITFTLLRLSGRQCYLPVSMLRRIFAALSSFRSGKVKRCDRIR